MSKTFKVPFAFNGDVVVDINSAKKGEVYKCSCGSDVKLRGGEIVSNHFYHIDESECSLESSIHKAYKAVFQKVKKIKLPYVVNGLIAMEFDKVEIETKIDDYIPDAIGFIGGERYLIEFAKSSYIGERKANKIKKSNLFCLEVDIIKTIDSIEQIESHLTSEKMYKHIIHIPEYSEMKQLRENFGIEYRKLIASHEKELQNLHSKIESLEMDIDMFEEIKEDCGLFHKHNCKNGAKMYVRNLNRGEIVAFQKGSVINLKFNPY